MKGPVGSDVPHTYTKDVPYAICLPLLAGAKALGVLNVNRADEPTESQVGYLRILAYQAAFAIERAGLYADLQTFDRDGVISIERGVEHTIISAKRERNPSTVTKNG